MGKIVFPNTDPLLDPAFASHEAQRCLPDQIALLQELRDHLRDLIKRAFGEHKDSVHDLVVIGGLSKQALVALDGLCICLEAGAAHAGHIQARAQWEATLFVEWILQNGRERWGRQYYVADIRRERNSTRRAIIGTPENAAYQELWRETYEKEPNEFSEEFVKKASEHLAEIDRILARPIYSTINLEFEESVKKRDGREPDWWFQPGGPKSIYDMAKAVDRDMVIGDIVLLAKTGGKTGPWSRLDGTAVAP